MNQSTIVFGFMLSAFVVFITMRGELRTYMGFLIGGGSAEQPSTIQKGVVQGF